MPSPLRIDPMLPLLLAVSGAPACGSLSPSAPATPEPPGWRLVFADEFETPGAPDPARWGYEIGRIRNAEAQYYTGRRENARVDDGCLVLEARREPMQGQAYTSASVTTRGRFEWTRGRVEVRAKLPCGNGTWPAIWLLGANIDEAGWPACGEIDVMENVGFDPLRIHGTVHTAASNHVDGTAKGQSVTVADPVRDFHVYAMEWHHDRIEISVDGRPYFTCCDDGAGPRTWPFEHPFYLLLNLAIGGTWGGQQGIDDTRFPHRFLIDYVRVYQAR